MHCNVLQVTRVIKIKAFLSFIPDTRKSRDTRHELLRAREASFIGEGHIAATWYSL
jgi:hypothetical protein